MLVMKRESRWQCIHFGWLATDGIMIFKKVAGAIHESPLRVAWFFFAFNF